MRFLALLLLVSASALAQTPLAVPQFAEPPESNGASPVTYPRHILWNSGLACLQRPWGASWNCFMTSAEVAAADGVLAARIGTLESQLPAVQTTATNAASVANAAQATANTNATAIATLQALPKRLCASFTVVAGVSVPLTGISSVQNVPLTGVPAGAVCDTGAPSRMPLGARPDPVVTTAGTVAMAFVSNAGLLSSVISIPSGTYKVCCDSF